MTIDSIKRAAEFGKFLRRNLFPSFFFAPALFFYVMTQSSIKNGQLNFHVDHQIIKLNSLIIFFISIILALHWFA